MTDAELRQLADEDYYHAQALLMTTATPTQRMSKAATRFS